MRRKYSTALLVIAATVVPVAAQCPSGLGQIAAEVRTLRNVAAPWNPPCRVLASADLATELDRKLRRDLPVAPELYLESLTRLGFIVGKPAEVYQRLLAFYATQVLAFYEPRDDEMVLVTHQNATSGDEMVWSHELAHAAQERRFKLASRLLATRNNTDQQRAVSAIAEGEALLVMFLLESKGTGQVSDVLARAEQIMEATREGEPTPPGVPDFFVKELIFPYTNGFAAVVREFRAHGWNGVDVLLRTPPRTTRELLHPGQGAGGPELVDADLRLPPGEQETVLTDTMGEWGLSYWLGQRLPGKQAAELAALLDSDRFALTRTKKTPARWSFTWLVRCRSEADREKLERGLGQVLSGLLSNLNSDQPSLPVTWSTTGRSLLLRAAWPTSHPQPPRTPS